MSTSKRSASSSRWLIQHFKDKFVKQAQTRKLRSRAWFKLEELQQRYGLFRPGMVVVDLGASPGGWSQYAASIVGKKRGGRVIACDRLSMDPIVGVDFLRGDFRDEAFLNTLIKCIGDDLVHVIMSDMAPNFSGHSEVDMPRAMYLAELALQMCTSVLAPQGSFIVKVFHSRGFDDYLKSIRKIFEIVRIRKPEASRMRSREIYIVAMGRK